MYNSKQITLYVPCYNAHSTIEQCLNSLINQTIPVYEILLINDGSSRTLPNFPGVKTINHPENLGLASARNTALKACKTPLIASIDSDVIVAEDWLEKLLEKMNDGDVVGVAGRLDEFYKEDIGDRWRARHMAQHWGDLRQLNPRFLYGANTLMKTESLRAVGGFDVRCRTNNEDRTICEQLYERGLKLAYEPAAKCFHLRRDTARTILASYWGWHHAKGVQDGDYDSIDGLTSRIRRVNFGICDYRYGLDEAECPDFTLLDLLIPLVFSYKDLCLYCRRKGDELPPIKLLAETLGLPLSQLENFVEMSSGIDFAPWYRDYLKEFEKCVEDFMLKERFSKYNFSLWLEENLHDLELLT